MKVGLVVYGSLDVVTGGNVYDRRLVSKLRAHGDDVEIISLPRRPYLANLPHNLTQRTASDFDVLLQDELCHPSLLMANKRQRGARIVSIVHHLRSSERRPEWENAIYRTIERAYLDSVTGFILNSRATQASVERLLRRPRPHVIATPGGDRLGESAADYVRQRAWEPGPLRLIFLASITPAKGLDVLLDALLPLGREDVSLEIIGSEAANPHYAERMHRKAGALAPAVTFCGELGEGQLAQRLKHGQALVVPSYYEGFGIAYLEGMAHGLPALATTAGAIPDLVSDGVNGYVVNPGDAHALTDRLRVLSRDRKLLERLSLGALARFRSMPTWDETTERVRDFLVSVARV